MITISDVDLQKAWLDVYATSGITVGTAVDIQNKGSDMVFVQVKGSAPAADNRAGRHGAFRRAVFIRIAQNRG